MERNREKNYFEYATDESIKKSYEGLFFVQVAQCIYAGSSDNSNPGKVMIQDIHGNHHEIVREDWDRIFTNSVNMLYRFCNKKLEPVFRNEIEKIIHNKQWDRDIAEQVFNVIMAHAHNSGIFGHRPMVLIWESKEQILEELEKVRPKAKS